MDFELRGSNWDSKIEELMIKSQDFNLYDMLKTGGQNSDTDQTLLLIQSLEKKLIKKFEYTDEKTKKFDEDMIRIKNDTIKNNRQIELLLVENTTNKKDIEMISMDNMKLQDATNDLEQKLNKLIENLPEADNKELLRQIEEMSSRARVS